jgi:hypothetical protein
MSPRALTRFLFVLVLLVVSGGTAIAVSAQIGNVQAFVPFGVNTTDMQVSVDLDGDGSDELVVARSISGHGNVTLHVLDWSPVGGYQERWGATPPIDIKPGATLVKYRRVDHASAEGVALLTVDAQLLSGGERFEGLPLRTAGVLPAFALERIVALGDFDLDGELGAITLTAVGVNHWELTATVPKRESAVPACLDLFQFNPNVCTQPKLANLDSDAQLELVLRSHQGLVVLDTATLAEEQFYAGDYRAYGLGNVDIDAESELVAMEYFGAANFSVFDLSSPTPRSTFSSSSFCDCSLDQFFLVVAPDDPDRVALAYTRYGDGVHRVALPDGLALPDIPGQDATGSPVAVVDLDGDGVGEIVVTHGDAPFAQIRVVDPFSLTALWSTYENRPGSLRWIRPQGAELVAASPGDVQGRVSTMDLANGRTTWNFPSMAFTNLLRPIRALATGRIDADGIDDLVVLTDRDVLAFSGVDRNLLWRYSTVDGAGNYRGINKILLTDLDADGRDELLWSTWENLLEVRSGSTGALLWSVPGSGAGNAIDASFSQLDADSQMELVIVAQDAVIGIDIASRASLFHIDLDNAATGIPLVTYRSGALELYTGWSFSAVHVFSLPALELLRTASTGQATPYHMSLDPQGAVIIGNSHAQGRLVALDPDTLETLALSQPFGIFGRYSIAAAPASGPLHVAGGNVHSFLEFEVTVNRSLYASGFEEASP